MVCHVLKCGVKIWQNSLTAADDSSMILVRGFFFIFKIKVFIASLQVFASQLLALNCIYSQSTVAGQVHQLVNSTLIHSTLLQGWLPQLQTSVKANWILYNFNRSLRTLWVFIIESASRFSPASTSKEVTFGRVFFFLFLFHVQGPHSNISPRPNYW